MATSITAILTTYHFPNTFLKQVLYFTDRDWIERTIARHDRDGDGGISLEEFFEMRTRTGAVAGPNAAAGYVGYPVWIYGI